MIRTLLTLCPFLVGYERNSESVQDDWLANLDSACSRLICLVKFEVQMNILFIFQSEDSRARQMVTQVLPILFDYRV